MRIRVSLVDYLNAAPLGWFLIHGPHKDRFEVLSDTPSRCADKLAAGLVDIGLIPSIEYQRIPGLRIVPGIAIGATSAVRSVILIRHRGRPIRSVALDTSSRTSVALLKLLLKLKMGQDPEFLHHPPDLKGMLRLCDAALLIGDAALRLSPRDYEIVDLAEAWVEWQKRPFVFSFWACRADADLPEDLSDILQEAKIWGLEAIPDIVETYSARLDLPRSFLLEYLSRNIDYDMAAEQIEGLERFYRLAHSEGLIPNLDDVRFLPSGALMGS